MVEKKTEIEEKKSGMEEIRIVPLDGAPSDAPDEKSVEASPSTKPAPKKRGRPCKPKPDPPPEPRKRGRPPKPREPPPEREEPTIIPMPRTPPEDSDDTHAQILDFLAARQHGARAKRQAMYKSFLEGMGR